MKEKYTKPTFAVELFTLSSTVAASGCGWSSDNSIGGEPKSTDKDVCGWYFYGDVYWTSENAGCETPIDENVDIGGICYNYPSGATPIFGSN